jgi:hypothetical protein
VKSICTPTYTFFTRVILTRLTWLVEVLPHYSLSRILEAICHASSTHHVPVVYHIAIFILEPSLTKDKADEAMWLQRYFSILNRFSFPDPDWAVIPLLWSGSGHWKCIGSSEKTKKILERNREVACHVYLTIMTDVAYRSENLRKGKKEENFY